MTDPSQLAADLGIILILILGISQFRTPRGARRGNLIEALALILATAMVAYRHRLTGLSLAVPALLVGGIAGWLVAVRVSMVQIPAMVAFQHGMGGIAAMLVSFVELTRQTTEVATGIAVVSGLLGLMVGSGTFSGSMIASGKLAGRLRQTPVVLPHHSLIMLATAVVAAVLAVVAGAAGARFGSGLLVVLAGVSAAVGILFAARIGGADMPVLISFLNATAGLAAAFCGLTIQNQLLIACGATVAASGSILTHVMCRAMNRSLVSVCTGILPKDTTAAEALFPSGVVVAEPQSDAPPSPADSDRANAGDPLTLAIEAAREAQTVTIAPGYGMALAEAQFEVVELASKLEAAGKQVRFAVHPVAGRMPGHMHVLLAEAEVDYQKLCELDQANAAFKETDIAIVVGACDVVNPAAIEAKGTPISGMPILKVHEAKQIVVCNLDDKPGYSGVPNPLYQNPKTILLLGDAKQNVRRLIEGLA